MFKNVAKKIGLIGLFFAVLLFSAPNAAKADEFEKPTPQSLVKMLVRFGALNVGDDDALNDYAIIEECKLYDYFYHDDFRWRDVQAAMRKSIRQNINVFPTGFHYDSALRLGRYDFKNGIYRIKSDDGGTAANSFTVIVPDEQMRCNNQKAEDLPRTYRFVLDEQIRIVGLPLTPDDADKLMKRMDEAGNKEHIVFARFNLRVVYVGPLTRKKDESGAYAGRYRQSDLANSVDNIRLDSRLESIDYYEDEAATKLIYSYSP
jgi:hypothetical protein